MPTHRSPSARRASLAPALLGAAVIVISARWLSGAPDARSFVPAPAQETSTRRDALGLLGGALLPSAVGVDEAKAVYAVRERRDYKPPDTGAYLSFWIGEFEDPEHPGCTVKVAATGQGFNVEVTGTDPAPGPGCGEGNTLTKWSIPGYVTSGESSFIYFDFSKKGGPDEVRARWGGRGIVFDKGTLRNPVPAPYGGMVW
eukprot:CAMPEP_0117514402 /NCGR_PEP_ID=MMETSP0784-20121206/30050_1 /TAXON_ID=39447 /ORGANISM="" /LENGTH=199 /DNA_ID=CAMNT_0005310195 /DNA_START=69 /DNA_END=665 /DNA_ORIENTATION=-